MPRPTTSSARRLAWLAATLALLGGCVASSTEVRWRAASRRIEAAGGERGGGEGAPAPTRFDRCEDVVRLALRTDPRLAAPRERARAALAMARAAAAYPAPSVTVSVWDFPIGDPSLADREGMYMLSVAQELPSTGRLDAEARAAIEGARESLATLAEEQRSVATEAARDCVAWASAAARGEALRAFVEVLRATREVAQARYAAASGTLADVLRIDRELAAAERAIERSRGDERRATERLRGRLGIEDERELGPAPPLDVEPLELSTDDALALARAHRGAFEAIEARSGAASARAEAAEARASVPTFMLGAMYMQTPGMRPGLGLELGMTLPWLWSGERDEAEALRAEARAVEAEAAGLARAIATEVRDALSAHEAAARALAVLREREAPATRAALDATAATYAAGQGTLLEWLDAARAIREVSLDEIELGAELAERRVEALGAMGMSLDEARGEPRDEPPTSAPALGEGAPRAADDPHAGEPSD